MTSALSAIVSGVPHAIVSSTRAQSHGQRRCFAARRTRPADLLRSTPTPMSTPLRSSILLSAGHVPAALQDALKVEFLLNRTLDRGNPHPGGIGSDFNRLGVDFWPEVYALHASNNRRRELLQELIDWRNAIAHQDFDPLGGDPTLHLGRVRSWRRAVNALTGYFDRVMGSYLGGLMGALPW